MNNFMDWYDALAKPGWTPEPSTIGRIWSILYPIIFAVNIYVWILYSQKKIGFIVVLPFLLNLISNFAFTPVQFGLKNLLLASIVIAIVWVTTLWSMIAIWPYSKWASLAFIPYLIWVSLASILQFSITYLNKQ